MASDVIIERMMIKHRYKARRVYCEVLGVGYHKLANIYAGNCATVEDMINICRLFGVNPTWLLLGQGNMFVESSPESSPENETAVKNK